MRGFLLTDIFGIHNSIVNGVEICITLLSNMDIMCLQTFRNKQYGQLVNENIYLDVCKRQFTGRVVVCVIRETQATYSFKCTEVRAYNRNKGNMKVTIEKPL